jgi:hypothetical protein
MRNSETIAVTSVINSSTLNDLSLAKIGSGTSITFVPEDDAKGQPVTVCILGRRLGGDRDEFFHQSPETGRWRCGKPRLPKSTT